MALTLWDVQAPARMHDQLRCSMQAMYSMGVVVLLPGSLLSLGAGAVYGLGLGALLTWIATIIGQTMAFLLGR